MILFVNNATNFLGSISAPLPSHSPHYTYMHKQDTSDETESLTIPNLGIENRVSLENVEE